MNPRTIVKTFNWSTIIKISSWGSIGASYVRNPRNPSTTRRPRSVVELCAGIRGESEEEGERERKRRAGRGHDGRRFYHPVEFIKKIRCSRRQHLIRRHAQRHGMILLDLSSFILSLSLSPSHFQRFIPQRSFSSLIDSPVSHPLSFRTDSTEGGTNSRVFLARVILAIFARGRAVLFERAVSSTRKKKKNRRITFDREIKREREKYTRTHTRTRSKRGYLPASPFCTIKPRSGIIGYRK